MRKNSRPLEAIEADLEAALEREARGPVEIGALLTEAKALLGSHGMWLLWLKAKFPHTARTAQNYMAAAALAAKYATIAHLRLAPGALYALCEADNRGDAVVVERVLHEAETGWVDADRVREIAREGLWSPPPSSQPEPDGTPPPPPPPPPPPGLKPKQARLVQDFDAAVAAFKSLLTKRAADFVASSTPGLELEAIANFLLQVARERSKTGTV